MSEAVEEARGLLVMPGNLNRVTHGTRSEALVSTVASDLADHLIENYPWFLETDVVGVEQYCRAEAKARMLDEYVLELADMKGIECVPVAMWMATDRADNTAMRAAEALGLTPLSRMKLAKDAGFAKHFAGDGVNKLRDQGRLLRAEA